MSEESKQDISIGGVPAEGVGVGKVLVVVKVAHKGIQT